VINISRRPSERLLALPTIREPSASWRMITPRYTVMVERSLKPKSTMR